MKDVKMHLNRTDKKKHNTNWKKLKSDNQSKKQL